MTTATHPGKRPKTPGDQARPDHARPEPARPENTRPENTRHVYGPRPIGALVPALTRPAFRKRAPGGAQVMADWAQIIGPTLSAITTPRRLSGGTLTLACAGPVALELQHLATELLARVNGHLGRTVVERLRFVQDPAAPPLPPAHRPRRVTPPIEVPGIPPGPLHDALAALGRTIGHAELDAVGHMEPGTTGPADPKAGGTADRA